MQTSPAITLLGMTCRDRRAIAPVWNGREKAYVTEGSEA
jgi:hypothetical protein